MELLLVVPIIASEIAPFPIHKGKSSPSMPKPIHDSYIYYDISYGVVCIEINYSNTLV